MPEPEIDGLTLARAKRGDEAAWRALVLRYQRPVFALLSRLLRAGRAGLVEDLAQETFLRAFGALSGFALDGPARFSTWLLTIATRLALHELRARRSAGERIDGAAEKLPAAAVPDSAARREVGEAIARAVGALAPEFQAAFLLREYHGLEYAEIARVLGIELGTVRSRLARARAALRVELAEVHDD